MARRGDTVAVEREGQRAGKVGWSRSRRASEAEELRLSKNPGPQGRVEGVSAGE